MIESKYEQYKIYDGHVSLNIFKDALYKVCGIIKDKNEIRKS